MQEVYLLHGVNEEEQASMQYISYFSHPLTTLPDWMCPSFQGRVGDVLPPHVHSGVEFHDHRGTGNPLFQRVSHVDELLYHLKKNYLGHYLLCREYSHCTGRFISKASSLHHR